MKLYHHYAQLGTEFSAHTKIQPLIEQRIVEVNKDLATSLGIDLSDKDTQAKLNGEVPVADSLSMVYAGHQFGGFSPQLGDGRGVLLGEVKDLDGQLHDIHVKGAGQTPFSRRGDGRAVLRSSIREYLAGEAMHALGVPSSRSLALFDSQQAVYREQPEPGALLVRTARTHIRFGHFEYFFAHKKTEQLQQLIDYTLEHYFPEALKSEQPIISMLKDVVSRTAKMVAKWQSIGFQHGVMNTDNFSILGETIDYGPYGFMEDYDDRWICNHSDYEGRYRFDRQPGIGLWNLNCLMRCFSGHLSREQLIEILQGYEPVLQRHYDDLMRAKLGLSSEVDLEPLVQQLFSILRKEKFDYTIFFRLLSSVTPETPEILLDEVVDRESMGSWLKGYWTCRLDSRDQNDVSAQMKQVNPKFVLRNYLAHEAIQAAEAGNYLPFSELLNVLKNPFDEHAASEALAMRAPDWGRDLEVSCSS